MNIGLRIVPLAVCAAIALNAENRQTEPYFYPHNIGAGTGRGITSR